MRGPGTVVAEGPGAAVCQAGHLEPLYCALLKQKGSLPLLPCFRGSCSGPVPSVSFPSRLRAREQGAMLYSSLLDLAEAAWYLEFPLK